MIIATSSEKAIHRRRRQENNPNRMGADGKPTASARTTYIGLDPNEMKVKEAPHPQALSPMAFLVEQDADSVLNPHFHKADQFQIFVRGDGKMASHEITGVCIQYTGYCTSYGPIIAGPDGLDYFTLRNNYLAKAYFMPGAREELRTERKEHQEFEHREVFGDVAAPRSEAELLKVTSVEASTVIEKTADGLGTWRYFIPPGQSATGPSPRDGGGQFWMVLSGELEDAKEGTMPKSSCVFVSPEEAPYVAKAGSKGLDIIVAQFPVKEFH